MHVSVRAWCVCGWGGGEWVCVCVWGGGGACACALVHMPAPACFLTFLFLSRKHAFGRLWTDVIQIVRTC